MKRFIDTIDVHNPELVPVIVEALEKDDTYEVEMHEDNDFDLERNRPSSRFLARLKIYKIERVGK